MTNLWENKKCDRHFESDGHVKSGNLVMSAKTKFLESSGKFFHIYNRGVNGSPIFIEERNYDYFPQKLWLYLGQSAVKLIAYCLTPNHFHLLVKQEVPLRYRSLLEMRATDMRRR